MKHPERRLLHTSHLSVRWGDMDALGHVNNTCFFTYFEQVRVEWLEGLDLDWMRGRVGPVVASTRCDFKRPVVYPAELEILLYAGPPGRTSVSTYYEARETSADDALCAIGEAVLVWVDYEAGRPRPLPEALRAHLPPPEAPSG